MSARVTARNSCKPQRGSMLLTLVLIVVALAGVGVLAVLLWPEGANTSPCGQTAAPPDAPPARLLVEPTEANSDNLSFSYINSLGKTHLLVFASGPDRNLVWFYPDGETRRESVPIEPCSRPRALPSPPRRGPAGSILQIHAVFTNEPLGVDAIETLVNNPRNSLKLLPIRGAVQDTVVVHVPG